MLLTLSERDQSLVHHLLTARPTPGHDLLPADVVDTLAQLVRRNAPASSTSPDDGSGASTGCLAAAAPSDPATASSAWP